MIARRGFLKWLPLAPLAAAVTIKAEASSDVLQRLTEMEVPTVPGYHHKYKGYYLRWTGWKYQVESECFAGQWLAAPIGYQRHKQYSSPQFIVASSGGVVHRYWLGYTFDISVHDQRWITTSTPEAERERIRKLTLSDLLAFIDKEG